MVGEKKRGEDDAGLRAVYVGGAHTVEERRAIVAGHAHEDSRVEREGARSRTIGCVEIRHSTIKILESSGGAQRPALAGGARAPAGPPPIPLAPRPTLTP